jgi:hypothetical protein
MNPGDGRATAASDEEMSAWEPGPDLELDLGIPPQSVLDRISQAVESDRLVLQTFNRAVTRKSEGRVLAEEFDFTVVEGAGGMNAFSLVCEGKVEASRRGSFLTARFQSRSLARLFLIAWSAFVFLIGTYEVMEAWPQLPSGRMLGVTTSVTLVVIALFVLAKRYSRRQEVRMRALLKDMFEDAVLFKRERPGAM